MSNATQDEYNTNIIHESLGDTTNFWGDYTLGELILFLIPPFGFLIAMGMPFVPAALFFPALGLAALAEVFLYILHKVRPDHYRLTEWLRVKLFWIVKKPRYTHDKGNQGTRQVTRLERIMPHGVERVDGAYVGAVEVEPANMALQDTEKWRQAVSSLTRLTESLTGQAKLHVTTAEVDNESHIQSHTDRLKDPDTQNHPIFRGVLMEWVNRYTDDNSNIKADAEIQRKYYIIVWVTDEDIHDLQTTSDSIADYLSKIPVIGRLFSRFDSDTLTDAEREEFKAKKLHDRLGTVDRAVSNLYRCRSRPVKPYELARLTEDYWACDTRSEREYQEAASLSPVTYSVQELIKHGDGTTAHDAAEGLDTDVVGGTEYETDDTEFVSQVHRPGENHRSLVAPTDIEWEADHALIDQETYTRCFWIETYPEHPTSGMLEQLLLDTDLAVDVSIHIDPYDSGAAVAVMEEWISSLKMLKSDMGEIEAEDIEQDVGQAKYIRQMVRRNHTSLFRVGVFIRLAAESEEELRKRTNRLETLLRDSPSNCGVKRTIRRQEAGLVTVSPIGANELGQNRFSSMTGDALGSLFPFSSNYLRMEDGIEYGLHGHNDSSLLIDPWSLETGHSELVTGMPGGGKTHGTQARAMRMLKKRSDVKQIYIDPVGDMHGSAQMLDAKTITISGETPLNPCEMHPTPDHVLE